MAARAASSRLGVAPPPSSSSSSSLRRARRPLSPRAARLVCSNTVGAGQVAHFAAAAGSQSGLSSSPWLGPALFFAPGAALALYSLIRGKGNLKDGFSRVLTEVSQGYFQPAAGGENIPEVDGDLSDLVGDEPLFVALYKWFRTYGGVYRLAFGPKAFLVVSDPVTARHVLRDKGLDYDKGMLAEILEPIMGKGLIPADVETWKVRRRAIVPGFHKAYLDAMVSMFQRCAETTCRQLSGNVGSRVDMEAASLSFALDVIGLAVFNYDFGSITTESPIIQAVYSVLKEAEHRSTFYLPYWNIPGSYEIVPRLRRFKKDLSVINDELDRLIERATETASPEDVEALQARDYSSAKDPSLLRFLVDLRGEDATAKQLRDDLMTMLIAGHETTAQVLTWAIFLLAQNPDYSRQCQDEVDSLFEKKSDTTLTTEDLYSLRYVRLLLAESLRLYPQPPLLIRRSLKDDVLPGGLSGDPDGYPIGKGTDLFISIWNLHRSPELWERPDDFDPMRFEREFSHKSGSGDSAGWSGFDPLRGSSDRQLYPNEIQGDFAFLPFGGGPRKCVGDQFAFMEAIVFMALFLRSYDFELAVDPKSVGMKTGATIHTANGLPVSLTPRGQSGMKNVAEAPFNVSAS